MVSLLENLLRFVVTAHGALGSVDLSLLRLPG